MTVTPEVLPVPGTSRTFADRVFAGIDFSGDCWEWTRAKNHGYGVIGRGRRGTGTIEVHRAVWLLLVGPVPAGLTLDHLCRNRACCNPDHLQPVTAAVNKSRGFGMAVLHAQRGTCRLGHPKDGRYGARGGNHAHRYCKTCARARSAARYERKGPKVICLRGHAFTPENTYTDSRGHRACKTCKIDRQRQRRSSLAAAA